MGFPRLYPLADFAGGLSDALDDLLSSVRHVANAVSNPGQVLAADATCLPLQMNLPQFGLLIRRTMTRSPMLIFRISFLFGLSEQPRKSHSLVTNLTQEIRSRRKRLRWCNHKRTKTS